MKTASHIRSTGDRYTTDIEVRDGKARNRSKKSRFEIRDTRPRHAGNWRVKREPVAE